MSLPVKREMAGLKPRPTYARISQEGGASAPPADYRAGFGDAIG